MINWDLVPSTPGDSHTMVPVVSLAEQYKQSLSTPIAISTLQSVVQSADFKNNHQDLLNLKIAILRNPIQVLLLNDSTKQNEQRKSFVLTLKKELESQLLVVTEIIRTLNQRTHNKLPNELLQHIISYSCPCFIGVPINLILPLTSDLEKHEEQQNKQLIKKQISATAMISYREFRQNNGCPDDITELAVKHYRDLIKERLIAYVDQTNPPRSLTHQRRLLLINSISCEQEIKKPKLTRKTVDNAIKTAHEKISRLETPKITTTRKTR